jgi:hypothetical protein
MIVTGHCEINYKKGIGNIKLKSIMFTSVLSIGRAYRPITTGTRIPDPLFPHLVEGKSFLRRGQAKVLFKTGALL